MPAVGIRRTMRVFGARVLRSGRRLWPVPAGVKHKKAAAVESEEWIDLLDNFRNGGGGAIRCKGDDWRQGFDSTQDTAAMDIDEKIALPKLVDNSKNRSIHDDSGVDRMWGAVYWRKRKLADSEASSSEIGSEKKRATEDRVYGKKYARKKWRNGKKVAGRVFFAIAESSDLESTRWLACFLNLVLRYMTKANVRLSQLSALMLSKPFLPVFSSHGIEFSWGLSLLRSSGICKIFGARCFIPLFTVDFSAIPSCFMYLHSSFLLRSDCLGYIVNNSSAGDYRITEVFETNFCGNRNVIVRDGDYEKKDVLAAVGPKLCGRSVQFRNGVDSRNKIQKRSSLRSGRGRNQLVLGTCKPKRAVLPDSFRSQARPLLALVASNRKLRSSTRRNAESNIKGLKSSLVELTEDIDSTSCFANILVVEPEKCYRVVNAVIKLEISASKKWSVAVRKDGILRYSLNAQKTMRPCSTNRVTNDIVWTEDNYSWKLEFPNRRDWLIFKELYRVCSERNLLAPTTDAIPVPRFHEIADYTDGENVPFIRPESYISMKEDELSRALTKRAAIYDLDSDDEDWLDKFNDESSEANQHHEHISKEQFELIVDAFEKNFFFHPDDCSDAKAASNLCVDLARKEVVEALYSYWIRKRKQIRSTLIRIYQSYRPRRDKLLSQAVLRKKRSFKRRPRHPGSGKQQILFQGMAAQQDALEEEKALLKVQETKAAASRSEELAIQMRKRAQLLMGNADWATFKAMVALRIAEAAQTGESSDAAASFFLH